MTSSSSALLLGRPTLSGMTVPGKTTMLRIGRMGNTCGTVIGCPLAPVRMVVPESVLSMTSFSAIIVSRPRSRGVSERRAPHAGPLNDDDDEDDDLFLRKVNP